MFKKALQSNYKVYKTTLFNNKLRSKNIDLPGILYTLYSDKTNLISIGFTLDYKRLESLLSSGEFILIDKKKGFSRELCLLKKVLNEIGILIINENNFYYSESLIRLLNTLGWPTGKSIYKRRIIRKKISLALS